ncbi:MAG: dihydrolipoyl dehydrogenase [SAR202 cluster bacterium Io17-Chloro-G7]|nr:MAG: dihydrolipoyl dehydrogenase [SAR202 cluster bacterium Io17-Chloro-G7]
MTQNDSGYDLVIVGGGPGGYVAAIRAGQLGLKTAVIERETLGGVCLNWGCIPSKSLLRNAEILSYFHRAEEFGFEFDNFTVDYSVAIRRSRRVVGRNTRGVGFLLRKNNVAHIEGAGRLKGSGLVEVTPTDVSLEKREISAKNIILATGARARSIPPLPVDGEKIITSREAIVLDDLPASIVIVGGGAIGVEFAYLYRTYGVEVTIVELLPRLVPNEDEDISPILERSFEKQGIKVMTGAGVTRVDSSGTGVKVTVDKDGASQTLDCEKVLVAIGIQANIEDLGLEEMGIETENRCIKVDANMATNVAGVYAVGDVTGKLALAHAASAQGVVAVEHIAGLEPQELDYVMMPKATYCHPQIASFGLTEAQAKEQGHGIKIGMFNAQANGKAGAMGESDGIVKLIVDDRYGELLGGHMIGPEVTELLGELAMTKLLEGTTLELGWAVHPHPSLSEMLKEAALDAQDRVIHM